MSKILLLYAQSLKNLASPRAAQGNRASRFGAPNRARAPFLIGKLVVYTDRDNPMNRRFNLKRLLACALIGAALTGCQPQQPRYIGARG